MYTWNITVFDLGQYLLMRMSSSFGCGRYAVSPPCLYCQLLVLSLTSIVVPGSIDEVTARIRVFRSQLETVVFIESIYDGLGLYESVSR
jgi:hypothetical protein